MMSADITFVEEKRNCSTVFGQGVMFDHEL